MDPRSVYEIWAPPGGPWSPWAKPVLFAHIHLAGSQTVEIPEITYPSEPPKSGGVAVVVDLPALEAIGLAMDLVRLGYRPVPLFNACPGPPGFLDQNPLEIVPARPLLPALIQGADRLKSASLDKNAPPAFLLDANRLGRENPVAPGWFDNRWVLFATDLPSANFLAHQQITTIEVIHRGALAEDLLDVLRDWNRQGIGLSHIDLDRPAAPIALALPRSWRLHLSRLTRRLWAMLSLRHNPGGGYGGIVPESESSGG